jgi:hypothetical protein
MIKISKYILVFTALFGVLFSSCEQDEPVITQYQESATQIDKSTSATSVLAPVPECTLISADWDGISMSKLQTKTFEIKYYEGAIYQWTVSGSIAIVGSANSNTVTVQALTIGTGGLSVTMDVPGNPALACGNTGTINVVSGSGGTGSGDTGGTGSGTLCQCPAPSIVADLCVSGGHPDWRFHVTGISSSDKIRWYAQHGTIMVNNTMTDVIVRVLEPGGFTVYCEVTRTCSNGSKLSRTAYYTNSYGQLCAAGTKGFANTCNGPVYDNLK